MLLRFLTLCLAAFACGCSHNPTTTELAQVYRTGMTREEAAATLGKPMRAETRPSTGWQQREDAVQQIGAFAAHFEQSHGATVRTCEVYWVLRGFMGMGMWWDYLFYGSDNRLLGFHRRFID